MTKKIKSGPDLDDLIAEKIFGLTISPFIWGGMEGDKQIPCRVWKKGEETFNPQPYSTDLIKAWRVVDHILDDAKKKEFPIDGSVFKIDLSGSGYNVGFWLGPGLNNYDWDNKVYKYRGYFGKAKADTLPHAICLAALKAVKD